MLRVQQVKHNLCFRDFGLIGQREFHDFTVMRWDIQTSLACIVHLKVRRGVGLRHFNCGFATLAAWCVALLCSRPLHRLARSGACGRLREAS